MTQARKLQLFVTAVLLAATLAGAGAWLMHSPSPGIWELSSFILVAFLLDQSSTKLRVAATGSTSFVIHMAAGILFGGFWGAVVAAGSTLLTGLSARAPAAKMLFNPAQRGLSVLLAMGVYSALGGGMPPAYLQLVGKVDTGALQVDLLLFFAYAVVYFAVNTLTVSGAIALSTNRAFRDVWNLNTRGVLAYDLGASAIALFVSYLYVWTAHSWGLGSFGLLLVFIPIVVVRHVYGLYHQLQDSGQELLQVMVKAIEARDPYTSGHSLRVSEFSRTVALELGLSAKDVESIETAALLHDVGKIHEEFAPLLRKDSRLTEEETALMQTHSTKSADLVGIITKFQGFIQDSVRHHHERWDGQGYPTGLNGKNIPLGSRIILISDTIDAMTTDRPYRKRLSLDIVIAELQKCKGTQFDPELVDVVISSVGIRRLIVGANPSADSQGWAPNRSKKVAWPSSAFWKTKRA
ncbi:MAG: HD-GYP domain-containing protein [Gemmatimonadales bacterium]|nr:HD-GYP domain-containing protein [Gemmatimonadales bacterium]MBA3727373.1 HD-GYP domain-containing protein [Armatimonadota bacterium]